MILVVNYVSGVDIHAIILGVPIILQAMTQLILVLFCVSLQPMDVSLEMR